MTIRKGQQWGTLRVPQQPLTMVSCDDELRQLIMSARESGHDLAPVGLLGGDLMRTLGGIADPARFSSGEAIPHLPVDIVRVVADELRETYFVAHLVARHSWWHGPITAAMNAQFLHRWDVSPRCHPNDGKVDIVEVSADMSLQQRWIARKRVLLGTHVPHPKIAITQRATAIVDLTKRTHLRVDGVAWGSGRRLEMTVIPDAAVVCV